jgi:DNA-binding MarR family transcriptional regulator
MPNDREKLARLLMETFAQSRQSFKRTGGGDATRRPGELMVLHIVHSRDDGRGVTVSEIGGWLSVTSPTVTQHLNRLEEQGLVERFADASDRRVVRIRLTGKGRQYVQRMQQARLELFAGLADHLGEEESMHFIRTMKKVTAYMTERKRAFWQQYEAEAGVKPDGHGEPDAYRDDRGKGDRT